MVSWEELENACQHCRACPLAETRTNVVFGVGSRQADILFIGEGPGEQEDLQGEPFVGPAGKLLDLMLSLIDLERLERLYCQHRQVPSSQKPRPSQHRAGRLHWVSAGPNRSAPA